MLGRVLRRVPAGVRANFTDGQLAALDGAMESGWPPSHPVNLRLTLFRRFYVALLMGPERGSPARRAAERARHPVATPGNVAVLVAASLAGLAVGYALHGVQLGG